MDVVRHGLRADEIMMRAGEMGAREGRSGSAPEEAGGGQSSLLLLPWQRVLVALHGKKG